MSFDPSLVKLFSKHDDQQGGSNVAKKVGIAILGVGAVGVAGFMAMRYKVSGPSQYVVRTGLGISDISITKKAIVWPFQIYKMMSIEPTTFPIEVQAMSMQRIPFKLPSVWTIGPANNPVDLQSYSRFLMDKGPKGVEETVAGVIQGETRVLTANMDLNELFSGRDKFKDSVVTKINEVVKPFGLVVYNANIAELEDLDADNRYFFEQKQRALQRVIQEARVSISEAIRDGSIGEKGNQTATRQQVAKFEKDAQLVENERTKEVEESKKNLAVAKATYHREQMIAEVEANAGAEKRQWELQMEVEQHRQNQEMEKLRADTLTKAKVDAERKIATATGEATATKLQAEAMFYAKEMEAKGILALREAEAAGLHRLITSAGSVDGLNKYLLVRDNVLPQLAEKQADALRGLHPKLMVWNTGTNSGTSNSGGSSLSQTMTDLFKTGMPLFDGIKQQTGYDFLKSFNVKHEADHSANSQVDEVAETKPTSPVDESVEDGTKKTNKRRNQRFMNGEF